MSCLVVGCGSRVVAHGYCDPHYRRWKVHGDPHGGRRPNAPKSDRCSVDDCEKSPAYAGMCSAHYSRLVSHGDPLAGAAFRQKPPPDGLCTVNGCRRKHCRRGYCASHLARLRKYGEPLAGPPIKNKRPNGMSLAQVLKHYTPTSAPQPNRCWEWTGKIGPNGYGVLTDGKRGYAAHRVSYELHNGPIPDGKMILHSCDNRRCVNPYHLRIGSHAENMLDRQMRLRTPRGRKIPNAKLTENEVREIRLASAQGSNDRILAERYGVTRSAIWGVVARKTWKHVV